MALTDGLKTKLGAIADAIREKNGTEQQYMPSEMAEEIRDLKVGELDFEGVFDETQADEINKYYKDGIEYAKEIKAVVGENPSGSLGNKLFDRQKLIYFPTTNTKNVTNFDNAFLYCHNLAEIELNTDNVTSMNSAFYMCSSCKKIKLTSIKNVTSATNTFLNIIPLVEVLFTKWKNVSLSFSVSRVLSPKSIRYILDNACTIEEGATNRTLTLHANAKANFKASFETEDDYNTYIAEIALTKDITIA